MIVVDDVLFREIKQCFEHKDCGAGQKCINQVQTNSMLRWSLEYQRKCLILKDWLAIAQLKPLSLFISLLLMLKKVFDNVKIAK